MKLFNKIKQKSPEIFVVLGITGVIVATVKACQATRHVDEILEEHEAAVEEIKEDKALMPRDEKREITKQYAETGLKLARLYGPSVALGTVSIISIMHGHGILQRRYTTLLATYELVDKSYKMYRKRVINELGEQMDRHFRFGETEEEITVETVDEDGKKKKEKQTVKVVDPKAEQYSPYARFFDETSSEWQDDAGLNKAKLVHVEAYANDYLKVCKTGKLFLNQVYVWLGFRPTKAGQRAGWDRFSTTGDHFVDLGIQEVFKRVAEGRGTISDIQRVNGIEPNWLLDFNCYDITGDMEEI